MQRILVLFFCLTAASSVLAQQSGIKQVPSSPQSPSSQPEIPNAPAPAAPAKESPQTSAAQAPSQPDYSQEAYVIEHFKQTVRFENDGTGREQTDARIKISSESGVQALGQLKIGYSALSDKLEINYVRVRKPDGTVITAQDSAVQDLTIPDAPVYTDYHQKHISVPSLRPGDILEYQYVRTIVTPLAPGQFWTSFDFSQQGIVLDEQLEINVPKSRKLKLKTKPGFDPKTTDDGDRRLYQWSHQRLSDDEEATPAAESKKKKGRKHKPVRDPDEIPTVELTTFQSWEELGAWYASLEKERRIPDAAIQAKADALTKDKPDNMAKVKALYEYVSRDYRYVSLSFGLGRYQPHAAGEVFSNGYGDCKDKNTLLAAMLSAEGFQSTSVLIGSQHKLDPDIPSPSQFDHVITRVPVDGKEIWLDSTNGVAPFRMLASVLRNKQALAIPPTGPATLVWTPADAPFDTYDRTTVAGTVSDTGKLTAHASMSARGDSELFLRFTLRQTPSNKWKDIFEYVLLRSGMRGAQIENLKVGDPSDSDQPLQVDFDLTQNNYFDWSAPESKLAMPLNLISLPDAPEEDEKPSPKPIKLGETGDLRLAVKLTIPDKYAVRVPIAVDVKRDYAEYHSSYKFESGQFEGVRSLKVVAVEVPYTRAADYEAFLRAVKSDQAQQVSLENKKPGAAGVESGESADDLNESGTQALRNGHYDLAIELLQRAVALSPKDKTAWNSLGLAYLSVNENDKAMDAFKKQLEINPYDEYAYNYLGRAYENKQQYSDAVQQYQKQIEINPLDPYAHANLGLLYSKQKNYAAALPELQKAVDIQPKNALLQVSLGEAYIAEKQTDKGMAAFDKAISLSPTPLTWNNIAYSLSEQDVQLDRAEKYADTAINAIETQLRDVSLDNLRMQDVGTATLLFSVWDTKGWVLYKRGDLDGAEKYINAAWLADGRGDVAEHLGDIAQKRGKHDQAIQYYIESLAVENPSAEARNKLTALGATKHLDQKIAEVRKQLQQQRTMALAQSGAGTGDFFLLLSPGKTDQAKFVRGDDTIKAMTDAVQNAKVTMRFPDDAQEHVPRRASVRCGGAAAWSAAASFGKDASAGAGSVTPGPCTLELLTNDQVRSVD